MTEEIDRKRAATPAPSTIHFPAPPPISIQEWANLPPEAANASP
jgi:hypothetical protein